MRHDPPHHRPAKLATAQHKLATALHGLTPEQHLDALRAAREIIVRERFDLAARRPADDITIVELEREIA